MSSVLGLLEKRTISSDRDGGEEAVGWDVVGACQSEGFRTKEDERKEVSAWAAIGESETGKK